MAEEYGIFNDEGCVEAGFFDHQTALQTLQDIYSSDDDLHISRICLDHKEQEAESCEICNTEDEDAE